MAKAKPVSRVFPRELLEDAAWSFHPPAYATLAAFEAVVRGYSAEMDFDLDWSFDEIVLPCPRVRIFPDFASEDEAVELTSDGSGFTAGELLFKTHNAVLQRWGDELGDHVFFEGLHQSEASGQPPNPNEVPLYEIFLGS